MAVGDNQGNTYTGREGVDKAFILPESRQHLNDAAKTIDFYVQQDLFKKQQAQKQKQADKAALNKAFEIEEPWYVFNDEIEREAAKVFQFAQDLNAAGINPMTDPSKEANQFRMELNRVTNAAKYSKQIQKPYEQTLATYNKNPDKFTQDSKNTVYNFPKNKSIFDMAKLGETVPTLEYKMPLVDLNPDIQGIADALDKDATDDKIFTVSNSYMMDDPQREAQIEQVVNNMSPAEKAKLRQYQINLAEKGGLGVIPSLNQAYAHRWVKDYMGNPEPFDEAGFLKSVSSTFIQRGYSYEDDAGVTRSGTKLVGDENSYRKTFNESLNVGLKNDPKMVRWYQSHLGIDYQPVERNKKGDLVPKGDRVTIKTPKDFANYLANKKFAQDKFDEKTGLSREKLSKYAGIGNSEEIKENYDQWWKALRGDLGATDDERKAFQREAMSYIAATKMAQNGIIAENDPEMQTIGINDQISQTMPALASVFGENKTWADLGAKENVDILVLRGKDKDGDFQEQRYVVAGPEFLLKLDNYTNDEGVKSQIIDREQGWTFYDRGLQKNNRLFQWREEAKTHEEIMKTKKKAPRNKEKSGTKLNMFSE